MDWLTDPQIWASLVTLTALEIEFEASQKVVPNRFRTLAGAAKAARESGSVETAKHYYAAHTALVAGGDGDRREISEARMYLAQN